MLSSGLFTSICKLFRNTLSVPFSQASRYEVWLGLRMWRYLYGKTFGLQIAEPLGGHRYVCKGVWLCIGVGRVSRSIVRDQTIVFQVAVSFP
jgi:hypothetical protein